MSEHLSDLATSFRRYLRAEGKAERTCVLYLQAIDFFCRWLTEQDRPATLDELNRASVREWLAHLVERGQTPDTVRTRFRGVHRFCNWLVAEEELDSHPMRGLAQPVAPAKPVPVLSDEQLAALIKACAGKDFQARRDEAVLRILLDTGIRVGELCSLTVDSLDLGRETGIVRGKGSHVRAIYFSTRTVRALDRYLRVRRGHPVAQQLPALFLSQRGALTTDGVRNLVKARGAAAGIENLHPHRFRHTYAHDFLLNGGQERDLKRLAGWSSDAMLSRYGASAADERARQATRQMQRGDRV